MNLQQILKDAGIFQYGVTDTAEIRFAQEVRAMCEVNTCRQYGKTGHALRHLAV